MSSTSSLRFTPLSHLVALGNDTGGTDTREENILLVREVIRLLDSVDVLEIVLHGLDDLEV